MSVILNENHVLMGGVFSRMGTTEVKLILHDFLRFEIIENTLLFPPHIHQILIQMMTTWIIHGELPLLVSLNLQALKMQEDMHHRAHLSNLRSCLKITWAWQSKCFPTKRPKMSL